MNQIGEDIDYIGTRIGQDLRRDVQYVEQKGKQLFHLETISHIIAGLLLIYVLYMLVINPQDRSVTNALLLLIAIGVTIQIHQRMMPICRCNMNA